ncbi:XapX domain-containing protein [Haloferacaceae archaeon DSL9]
MNLSLTAVALATGAFAGALFAFLEVPMPAPPELPGLMGIVGVYLGYKLVTHVGVSYDVLDVLGI